MKIADYLGTGKAHAVPLETLRFLTRQPGRTVRKMIAAERIAGSPILSDSSSGYYLAGSEAERAQFVRSMRHRAGEILKAAQAVENGGTKDDNQLCIDGVES